MSDTIPSLNRLGRTHTLRPMLRRATRLILTLVTCAWVSGAPNVAHAAPRRPIPYLTRVLIVSVDGLRGDLALRANAPTLHALLARGSFTMWARTTDVAVTLPSHVSMLTGVPPEKHRVDWNNDQPGRYPAWPTLFEIARLAGYTTAMAAGKSKFHALEKAGSLNWSYVPGVSVVKDASVADTAVAWIALRQPQVFFVHLPGVDTAGHKYGWGSPEQLAAIAVADASIGRMLQALRDQKALDSTLVIVSSDHGGAGKSHGAGDSRSLFIPWIAAGAGVCANLDLTTDANLTVKTEDTFATAAYVLGLTPSRPVDGKPVMAIFCGSGSVRLEPQPTK
jgi:type I phosphodiesterase/nucleotide pyrophosphatase